MSTSSISSSTLSTYLQYLTGTDTDSSTSVRTTYLDKASEGTVLTRSEQKAAQAQLKAVNAARLFDISV